MVSAAQILSHRRYSTTTAEITPHFLLLYTQSTEKKAYAIAYAVNKGKAYAVNKGKAYAVNREKHTRQGRNKGKAINAKPRQTKGTA